MIFCLLMFLVLSSGSILGCVSFNRKFEEFLPLTIFSIIILLYFFGYFGIMRWGVYSVVLLAVVFYFVSFMKNTLWKKISKIICSLIFILLVPLVFDSNYLKSIYVDSILAIVSGYIFAIILIDKKDIYFWVKLAISISTLILLKDAVKLFAAMALCMIFAYCFLKTRADNNFSFKKVIYNFRSFIFIGSVILVIILSWSLKLQISGVTPIFNGSIDIVEFLKTIINKGTPEHVLIYKNFISSFSGNTILSFLGLNLHIWELWRCLYHCFIFVIKHMLTILNLKLIYTLL